MAGKEDRTATPEEMASRLEQQRLDLDKLGQLYAEPGDPDAFCVKWKEHPAMTWAEKFLRDVAEGREVRQAKPSDFIRAGVPVSHALVATSKRPEGMSDAQVKRRLQEIMADISQAKLQFLNYEANLYDELFTLRIRLRRRFVWLVKIVCPRKGKLFFPLLIHSNFKLCPFFRYHTDGFIFSYSWQFKQ